MTKQQAATRKDIINNPDGSVVRGHHTGGKRSRFEFDADYYCEQAQMCAEKGMTEGDIAKALKISVGTYYGWKNTQPAFAEAIILGKRTAVDVVERALYQSAVGGQEVIDARVIKKLGIVVQEEITKRQLPPSVSAQMAFLKNKRPDEWKDRHDISSMEGISLSLNIVDMSKPQKKKQKLKKKTTKKAK